jgi:hypothetical protein
VSRRATALRRAYADVECHQVNVRPSSWCRCGAHCAIFT